MSAMDLLGVGLKPGYQGRSIALGDLELIEPLPWPPEKSSSRRAIEAFWKISRKWASLSLILWVSLHGLGDVPDDPEDLARCLGRIRRSSGYRGCEPSAGLRILKLTS